MRGLVAMLLAFVFCGATCLASENELKTYALAMPDAEAMMEAVKLLAGPRGRVIHDKASSRMFVLAPPDAHRQIEALLKEADVPLRNVRVDVVIEDAGQNHTAGAGVSGSGGAVISPRGTRWGLRLNPSAQARSSKTSNRTRQTLVVRDGGEAAIRVARQVPYEETLVEYGRQWGYIEKRLVMRDVGASLRIQPRIIGNGPLIALRITPELSGLTDEGVRTIQYSRVATDVTVRDGRPFSLGGLGEDSEFFSKFLIGVDKQGAMRNLTITATPHIVMP